MTDITSWLESTHREIRDADTDARTVVLRRSYDAAVEDVWSAIVDPDRLKRWFLPVTGDLRPGGRFELEGNAGGEILACEPPRLLRLTWAYGDHPASEVAVRLASGGDDRTVLELEHLRVPRLIELDGRQLDVVLNDAETGIWGLGTGWEIGLVALGKYLAGEMPADYDAETFEATPEIAKLGEACGAAWAAVVQASG